MTDILSPQIPGIRTFQLIVPVTGFLEGTLDDWPARIQDGILEALDALSAKVELPLAVVASRGGIDEDKDELETGRFYIHVVASEIVAADERTLHPGSVVKKGI